MKLADLARRPDFQLGDLRVSPARRRVTGPDHTRVVEPQFMIVFLRLLESAGRVVTRMELFDECWGGAVVGDDSLNRAVAGARQIASAVGSSAFVIETVPRMGYMLKLTAGVEALAATGAEIRPATDLQSAVEDAYDCWRSGFPTPDCEAIDLLDRLLVAERGDARAWGILALLLRKAAEYAPPDECAAFVRRCEQAVRRALAQDPGQNDARVALSGIVPIFRELGKGEGAAACGAPSRGGSRARRARSRRVGDGDG